MDNPLYTYSPFNTRPPMELPEGKRLAFYIGLNIEHFRFDLPSFSSPNIPDPIGAGWRDYGTRVGIWRLLELFDEVGIRASGIINSDVCKYYPQIIDAGIERDWAWIGHGQTNSLIQTGMEYEAEKAYLAEMCDVFDASLPSRPTGWLGPGLTETMATPQLLRDLGFEYLLDWCCDDQPFSLKLPGMVSVPYSIDVNDIALHLNGGFTGPDYETVVMDQFEGLLADSEKTAMVMALPLHTFIVGQPYRFKYLARVLRTICANDSVWVCTSDDIARHYIASTTAAKELATA